MSPTTPICVKQGFERYITTFAVIILSVPSADSGFHHMIPHLTTYDRNGIICYKCPPGKYLYKHCSENFTPSECRPCPPGTFQRSHTQARICQSCDPYCFHDINMVVEKNCTPTENLKCVCKPGYYLYHHTDTYTCKILKPCSDEQITIRNGTSTSQYKCSDCQEDEFYNIDGECQKCLSCEDTNSVQLSACNATSDVICQGISSKADWTILAVTITVGAVIAVCIGVGLLMIKLKRRSGRKRQSTSINTNRVMIDKVDSPTSQPLLHIPGTSSTSSKRTRSLSDSSTASTTSHYPELTDPNTWTNDVFDILSHKLSTNWRRFMRNLPGSEDWRSNVDPICDHIEMEEKSVQEQIYKALRKWAQFQGQENVTVDDILHTLYKIGDCEPIRKEIKQLCRRLNKNKSKRPYEQTTSTV